MLPIQSWLQSFLAQTEALGPWGPVALVGVYILACVLLLPGSVLTLGAGAAFGLTKGLIAVSLGSTLGACAAFAIGRYLARSRVEAWIQSNPRFRALDEAVGRDGRRIVFLTRLSPVFPFNLLNFFYGITQVRFLDYALASWIGMLPGTVVFVYSGSLGREAAKAATGGGIGVLQGALYGIGFLATVFVSVKVGRLARESLELALEESDQDEARTPKEDLDGPA